MSALLLTAAGDLDLSNGGFQLTDGQQQIAQNLRSRLRTFQGEWFLDATLGLPYFQTIFQKGISQSVIEGLLRQCILTADGVIELTAFSFTPNNQSRSAQVTFTAQTTSGPITTLVTV